MRPLIVTLAVALSAPLAAMAETAPAPATYEAGIRAYLNGALLDGESARIGLQRPARRATVKTGGLLNRVTYTGWIVCYQVNAKNAYGAFTGFKLWGFVLGDDGKVLSVIAPTVEWGADKALEAECAIPAPSAAIAPS